MPTARRYLDNFFDHVDVAQLHRFCKALLGCRGTVFLSGVGKSGFIAQKVCMTLVSSGTRAAFLSPIDALHGDIGGLSADDVLVLFRRAPRPS